MRYWGPKMAYSGTNRIQAANLATSVHVEKSCRWDLVRRQQHEEAITFST